MVSIRSRCVLQCPTNLIQPKSQLASNGSRQINPPALQFAVIVSRAVADSVCPQACQQHVQRTYWYIYMTNKEPINPIPTSLFSSHLYTLYKPVPCCASRLSFRALLYDFSNSNRSSVTTPRTYLFSQVHPRYSRQVLINHQTTISFARFEKSIN